MDFRPFHWAMNPESFGCGRLFVRPDKFPLMKKVDNGIEFHCENDTWSLNAFCLEVSSMPGHRMLSEHELSSMPGHRILPEHEVSSMRGLVNTS